MKRHQDMTPIHAQLTAWLKSKMPQARSLSISTLMSIGGGFSNETHAFDLHWREGAGGAEKVKKLVIRWAPQDFVIFPEYDVKFQYDVMKCLKDSDVPVPEMYWFESNPDVLGVPFFVMEWIEGETIPDTAPGSHGHGLFYEATPERRSRMWWRSVETLARVHAVNWEQLGLSFAGSPESGVNPVDQQIQYWERCFRWAAREPLPIIEAGFDWVKAHRFEPSRVSLCWGDAKAGNFMYRNDEVVAALDWELAYLGPPEADLVYFISIDQSTSETHRVARLEGIPQAEETIRYYEQITGRKVENFAYHEVFQALKLAVIIVLAMKAVNEIGMPGFPPDLVTSNWSIRKLEGLLKTGGGL